MKKLIALLALALALALGLGLAPTAASAHHREYERAELTLQAEGICDRSRAFEGQIALGGLAKMEADDPEGEISYLTLDWRLFKRGFIESTHRPYEPWKLWDSVSVESFHETLPSGYGPKGGYADANWKLQLIARWYTRSTGWSVARHQMVVAKLNWSGACEVRRV
jgi:hypothetical protein